MRKPGGEIEACGIFTDFAAQSFLRRLAERGNPLVRSATPQPAHPGQTPLESRIPAEVGGPPLLRGQVFGVARTTRPEAATPETPQTVVRRIG